MKKRSLYLAAIALLAASSIGTSFGKCQEPLRDQDDASLTLRDAFKPHFRVGVALNRSITTGRAFRRPADDVAGDIDLVKRQFNHIVAENDMKWQIIHPRPGKAGYDFGPADAFISFGEANQMEIAGHTLVWHSQTPNWVFEENHSSNEGNASSKTSERRLSDLSRAEPTQGSEQETTVPLNQVLSVEASARGGMRGLDIGGPRVSRAELLARMRDHIHTVVGRYKGKVKVWDVVNEAVSDDGPEILRRSPWSVMIGPDFIAKAFEYAHEADPNAILRYNDYGLEDKHKRNRMIALIKILLEQKVPVMAIGSQGHCNVTTSFDSMDQTLTELETLGLPIHITELDVNSSLGGQRGTGADIGSNEASIRGGLVLEADRRLASAYSDLFRAFVKHSNAIEVVTFWGVNDAVSWRAAGRPLLFDGRSKPKIAYRAVLQTAKGE